MKQGDLVEIKRVGVYAAPFSGLKEGTGHVVYVLKAGVTYSQDTILMYYGQDFVGALPLKCMVDRLVIRRCWVGGEYLILPVNKATLACIKVLPAEKE